MKNQYDDPKVRFFWPTKDRTRRAELERMLSEARDLVLKEFPPPDRDCQRRNPWQQHSK